MEFNNCWLLNKKLSKLSMPPKMVNNLSFSILNNGMLVLVWFLIFRVYMHMLSDTF